MAKPTIGLIGAGHIGSQVARLAISCGYPVVIGNSRGPDTLAELVAELGPRARAATAEDAAKTGEIVVVSVPLKSYREVPVAPLAGKVVIDTNNYYPDRDGTFPELDAESTTTSELLQAPLPESTVVKGFNNIHQPDLADSPAGTALPIAGDDDAAKKTVADFFTAIGLEADDAGPLAEGWRFQRDTPGYVTVYKNE